MEEHVATCTPYIFVLPSARLTAEDVVMSFERNGLVGEIADGNPIGDVSAIGAFDFYARRMRACAGGRGHDFRCDEVVFRPVVGEPGFRGVMEAAFL